MLKIFKIILDYLNLNNHIKYPKEDEKESVSEPTSFSLRANTVTLITKRAPRKLSKQIPESKRQTIPFKK